MTSPVAQNREVNVTVNANVDPFAKSMGTANTAVTKLTDGLKKLDEKLQSIAKKAGAGISGAGAGGMLSLLGSAREAAQLEKSFEELSAMSVRTGESIDKLVSSAKGLTRDIPASTEAIAGLMMQVKMLGIDGVSNIERMTRVSAELSAATNTAPGQLFTGLAEQTRTMGNSIQDIERYGSSVTALSQELGVSAAGVGAFGNQILAVAQKAGVSQTEVNGLAAAFQRVGADGFAGANMFNRVINDISDAIATNSTTLNSYANLLGMTREEFKALGQENPAETFVRFIEAIQAQGPKATQTLERFGLESVRSQRVVAQLTTGAADLRGALGLSADAFVENTATTESAAAAWDGTADSFQKLQTAAHNLATTIGGPLSDALKPFIDVTAKAIDIVSDFWKWLNDLPGPFKNLASYAATGVAGIMMLGGALVSVSWSAIKFLAVWRAVSGMLGINAWRGLADGIRGTTRSVDQMSRAGQGLYATTQYIAATASPIARRRARRAEAGMPVDDTPPTLAQRVSRGFRQATGAVALFPVTRLRQMGREMGDTLRHPFSPEKRDLGATDPWSALGMIHGGQRFMQNAREKPYVAGPMSAWNAGVGRASGVFSTLQDRLRTTGTVRPPTVPDITTMGNLSAPRAGGGISGLMASIGGGLATAMSWGRDRFRRDPDRKRDADFTTVDPSAKKSKAEESADDVAGALGGVGEKLGDFAEKVGSTSGKVMGSLGKLAGSIGGFLTGPWGILAMVAMPFLISGFEALGNAAKNVSDKLAYTGAEMAQRIGREFRTPAEMDAERNRKEPEEAFGQVERDKAREPEFEQDYANTLGQIEATADAAGQLSRLQLEINRTVEQNRGAPLDNTQQSEIRQLLINLYGPDEARRKERELDYSGRTESNWIQTAVSQYASTRDEALMEGLATDAITEYMGRGNVESAAYVLAETQLQSGGNKLRESYDASGNIINKRDLGSTETGEMIDQIIAEFNEQTKGEKNDIGQAKDDLGGWIDALQEGTKAEQAFAEQLLSTGIEFDSYNRITATGMERLAVAANGAAAAIEGGELATAMEGTSLNDVLRMVTGDSDAYLTDVLSNPQNIDYGKVMNQLGEGAGRLRTNEQGEASYFGGTIFDESGTQLIRDRIRQFTEAKNVIGDPDDPTYQALDKLLGNAYGQLGTVTSSPIYTQTEALREYSSVVSEIDVADPLNAGQYEQQTQALTGMVNQNLGVLHGYYTQVRDLRRSLAYGEEDHNRQLARMERDRNIQLEETYYQRNEQLRIANYNYAEQQRLALRSYNESIRDIKNSYDSAFGNPAAFVQSQYTQSGSSAMLGMDRQVEYLRRSLKGLGRAREMGVSNDVIKLLGLDDPNNFQQLEKYLVDWANDPRLVQEFNSTIRERLSLQQALATDPSNSQTRELDRQFKRSADEAERAFTHAAEESARAFQHSFETSEASYERGLGDMIENYEIGVGRAWDNIERLGENVSLTTEALLTWAKETGVQGIQDLGTAIGEALGVLEGKQEELLGWRQLMESITGDLDWVFGSSTTGEYQDSAERQARANGRLGGKEDPVSTNQRAYGSADALERQLSKNKETQDKVNTSTKDGSGLLGVLDDAMNKAKASAKRASGPEGVQALNDAIDSIPKKISIKVEMNTNAVVGALTGMQTAISTAMQGAIRSMNQGVIGSWNYIVREMGLPSDLRITPFRQAGRESAAVRDWKRGGGGLQEYAVGGYTGHGGKHDPAGIVHAGEYVIRQEQTRKFMPLLDAINKGQIPGYETGGQVGTWPQLNAIRQQMFPGSVMTSWLRNTADWHGQGMAIDIGVPGNDPALLAPIARRLAREFPQSTELINNPGGSIKNGQQVAPSFWGPQTWADHADHVHWAMTPGALKGIADSFAASPIGSALDPIGYMNAQVEKTRTAVDSQALAPMIRAVAPAMVKAIDEADINSLFGQRRRAASGGIFTRGTDVHLGEAGPETILPLNAVGAEFMSRTIQATLRNGALNEMREQRTGTRYATPQASRVEYHSYDQSNNYGGVTVMANDPREFERKLDARKRAQALTRPMGRR